VVAVDQVFNPIAALRRSWSVTRGKVWRILLALLGFIGISLLMLGVPMALVFGIAYLGQDSPAVTVIAVIIGFLLFIPLTVVFGIFTSTFTAALHCEVTGGGAERLEAVFA
jgi:membrane-anchored glycerophosphoryl diester phosphodiesterase (GDPDase)